MPYITVIGHKMFILLGATSEVPAETLQETGAI
jgi:hypothetical protein